MQFCRHQNSIKCFGADVFCTFSLPNVLLATAACNFSTSELQKVLRHRQFFSIFTSKCAFRHSGVQFLISSLSTYLRTRRFNRPSFGLTRHTNHWKNTAFRDFSNIWRGCIFFLLTFALLHLLSADLTTLLCFSTVHIVGCLLFKLPSNIFNIATGLIAHQKSSQTKPITCQDFLVQKCVGFIQSNSVESRAKIWRLTKLRIKKIWLFRVYRVLYVLYYRGI